MDVSAIATAYMFFHCGDANWIVILAIAIHIKYTSIPTFLVRDIELRLTPATIN
jgi:hypothetical protein